MSEGILQQLKNLMTCSVCLEEKGTQKLLPCQHTLCVECLAALPSKNSALKCPLCKKVHAIPNGGVIHFPDSLACTQISDIISRGGHTAAPRQVSNQDKPKEAIVGNTSKGFDEELKEVEVELEREALKHEAWISSHQLQVKYCEATLSSLEEKCEAATCKINEFVNQKVQRLEKMEQMIDQHLEDLVETESIRSRELQNCLDNIEKDKFFMLEYLQQLQSWIACFRDPSRLNELQSWKPWELLNCFLNLTAKPKRDMSRVKEGDNVHYEIIWVVEELKSGLRRVRYQPEEHKPIRFTDVGRAYGLNPTVYFRKGNSAKEVHSSHCHVTLEDSSLPARGTRVIHLASGREGIFQHWVYDQVKVRWSDGGIYPEEVPIADLKLSSVEPFKKGEEVWLCRDLVFNPEVFYPITEKSVGRVVECNKKTVIIDFPECLGWQGRTEEVEWSLKPWPALKWTYDLIRYFCSTHFVKLQPSFQIPDEKKERGLGPNSVGKITQFWKNSTNKYGSDHFIVRDERGDEESDLNQPPEYVDVSFTAPGAGSERRGRTRSDCTITLSKVPLDQVYICMKSVNGDEPGECRSYLYDDDGLDYDDISAFSSDDYDSY